MNNEKIEVKKQALKECEKKALKYAKLAAYYEQKYRGYADRAVDMRRAVITLTNQIKELQK